MDDINIETKAQTRRNLFFNIFNLSANIIVGLLYTPFLVRNLGIVAYGVLPLALIINQYINVLTGSLTSSLTRFYSIAIQQNKVAEASKCINTAFGVILVVFIVLLFPTYFLITKIDNIFTISIDLLSQAKILFFFTISSFFISLISSVLNITLYANNRLDYLNVIKIVRTALKFGFVVLFFTVLSSDIVYVGYAFFLTEIIVLILSVFIFKTLTSDKIKFNIKYFDKVILNSMLSMTMWIMIVQIGDTGLYRIDNLIVNRFWSTEESGVLGAFTELGTYVMVSLAVLSSIFGPLILIAYSKGKHKDVVQMAIDRSLIVGVIAAVITGLVIGFSSQISKVWLGEGFERFHTWLILKVILIPFYTASGVFAFIYRAWNRAKIPALMTATLGVINLVAAIFIAKFSSPDYDTIIIILGVGAILGITQSYILNGWYVSRIYPTMKFPVLKNFILIIIVLSSISLCSYITNLFFPYDGFLKFVVVISITLGISFVSTFILVFTKEQRTYIFSLVNFKS